MLLRAVGPPYLSQGGVVNQSEWGKNAWPKASVTSGALLGSNIFQPFTNYFVLRAHTHAIGGQSHAVPALLIGFGDQSRRQSIINATQKPKVFLLTAADFLEEGTIHLRSKAGQKEAEDGCSEDEGKSSFLTQEMFCHGVHTDSQQLHRELLPHLQAL